MMLASAVGLPVPEEVTLVSAVFLAFMGSRPDLFPPPFVGAPVVNVHEAAFIAFIAVFGSDFLIYGIGRKCGRKILYHPRMRRLISEESILRVENWTKKYGNFAVFVFRFTPGVRFPGHLATGMLKFSAWKFALIDGLAALVSVPTQIYLLAHYGKEILVYFSRFKLVVLAVIAVVVVIYLFRKFQNRNRGQTV